MTRLLFFLLILAVEVHAGGFRSGGHGRLSEGEGGRDGAIGSCASCHSDASDPGERAASGLKNTPQGCVVCHNEPDIEGVYPGRGIAQLSVHNLSSGAILPDYERRSRAGISDADDTCIHCHDPHGREDNRGVIPSLLRARDQELCLGCHGGRSSAIDIDSEIRRPYSHSSIRGIGEHSASEAGNPQAYSYSGSSRHVSCSDCHNAHVVKSSPPRSLPPEASQINSGVGRVSVRNGSAGSVPAYEYLTAADTGVPTLEYELCFKCHSSWTQAPAGQPDMARLFNPQNASHHAVEAAGNNRGIRLDAFVASMSPDTVILCSDCHGSSDDAVRGPHGSIYSGMLRRPYDTRDARAGLDPDGLCFSCHNYDTYAVESGFALEASRFNPPAAPAGHAIHVGREQISCHLCHDSHGSPEYRALIRANSGSGMLSFAARPDGGSCQTTCHAPRDYRGNYPW